MPRLPAHAPSSIHQFLRSHLAESGAQGLLVGLSGGIDSALVARLSRDAVGAEKVHALLLPDAHYSPALRTEVEDYAKSLGISLRIIAIDAPESAIRSLFPEVTDRLSWGNVKARLRMVLWYLEAREHHWLVVGTGNKSELLTGYFTKWGDGGVDLLPIGDLYKTQVRELAAQLALPRSVLDREPTAGLWEGQTDEKELGLPYSELDQILYGMEQLRTSPEIARATGFSEDRIRAVEALVQRSRHKRRPPPIPKLGLRTIGIDWRE